MQIIFSGEVIGVIKTGENKYTSTIEFKRSPEKYAGSETLHVPILLELGTKLFVTVSDTIPQVENKNNSRFFDHPQPVEYPLVNAGANEVLSAIDEIELDKNKDVV